jgi:hypothetical protein
MTASATRAPADPQPGRRCEDCGEASPLRRCADCGRRCCDWCLTGDLCERCGLRLDNYVFGVWGRDGQGFDDGG